MPLLKIIQLYCNGPLIDGGNSIRQKNIHFLKNSPTLFLIILKFLICHIFIYSASALNTFSPFFFIWNVEIMKCQVIELTCYDWINWCQMCSYIISLNNLISNMVSYLYFEIFDIVSIKELTPILKIIGLCELQIKTITSVLNVLTYVIMIISVST